MRKEILLWAEFLAQEEVLVHELGSGGRFKAITKKSGKLVCGRFAAGLL